jgi:CRP/FNR family cyclic AMP-dependent transcriptional regulator
VFIVLSECGILGAMMYAAAAALLAEHAPLRDEVGALRRGECGIAAAGVRLRATLFFRAQHPIISYRNARTSASQSLDCLGANMEDKIGYLSDIDLFRDLSDRDRAELERMTTITTVPRGRVFYQPEDISEVLFLVRQGRVQLYRISPEGKKLVIATLGPGTLFGEMALLGQQMHNTFAEALDDCSILVMSRTDLERLILSKPILGQRMLEITGRRLSDAEARLEDMAFKGIPARLASLLLRLAVEHAANDIFGLTHQDLAETIGTYRETATQVLNDMKAAGLIEIGRKRITILDTKRLQELAQG